jgi:hypothetical protein
MATPPSGISASDHEVADLKRQIQQLAQTVQNLTQSQNSPE